MSARRGFRVWLQVLLWAAGNSAAGAMIGLAVGSFLEEGIESPVILISVLFGNVVGFTVLVASLVVFPRIRGLGPVSGGALLVLALASGSVAGTVSVLFLFPLFVLRDVRLALAVIDINVVLALIVGGVVYAYEGLRLKLGESLREVEEVRLVEARLREEAAVAKLQALQARINPHFFFNTLNTISSLLDEDPEHAEEVVQTLADLFRYTFRAAERPVPLGEELDFVRDYLKIEQARFGERLRVRWSVDPAARAAEVPGLLLQPLVENAVAHGIAPRKDGGALEIAASLADGRLVIEVADDGVGLPPGGPAAVIREGHGLSNVQRRLEAFYAGGAVLELRAGERGGTVARLVVPAQTPAPAPVPAGGSGR